jgi:hypothetical protein
MLLGLALLQVRTNLAFLRLLHRFELLVCCCSPLEAAFGGFLLAIFDGCLIENLCQFAE